MYSTGHIDKKEVDQPKPTTGEWTIHHPLLASLSHNHAGQLAEAINASLAAEREARKEIVGKLSAEYIAVFNKQRDEIQQLREQLAASEAQDKRHMEKAHKEVMLERRQLAASQAAIKLIKARCENTNPTRHAFEDILEWCKGDTTALDAAIEEAKEKIKTLVDAAKEVDLAYQDFPDVPELNAMIMRGAFNRIGNAISKLRSALAKAGKQ